MVIRYLQDYTIFSSKENAKKAYLDYILKTENIHNAIIDRLAINLPIVYGGYSTVKEMNLTIRYVLPYLMMNQPFMIYIFWKRR